MQWYSRTPARTPTTNAMVPVTTIAISKVAPVLRIVGATVVITVVGRIPDGIITMVSLKINFLLRAPYCTYNMDITR